MSLQDNAIKLSQAISWTRRWRKNNPNSCNAYLVPTSDLVNLLIEMEILSEIEDDVYRLNPSTGKDIRAYHAMAKEEDQFGFTKYEQKLLLVGTQLETYACTSGDSPVREITIYRDMINGLPDDGIKRKNGGDGDVEDGSSSGIYDLSHPCPPFCDPNSPLF